MTDPDQHPVRDHPSMIARTGQVEPAPRRVRGVLAGEVVLDTTRASYVWEWPNYPQYYVPVQDVARRFLVDGTPPEERPLGWAQGYDLHVGPVRRPRAAYVHDERSPAGIAGTARLEWSALDAWFEEDEEIFVHPRNPYTRVDAVRSHRHLTVELEGVVLADTRSPVMLFETGLPTRYYVDKTDVRFEHLVESDTRTSCPYKGTTSSTWSIAVDGTVHPDLAWCYDHPTPGVVPIAGMVAFYNEKVDVVLDGVPRARPSTHFFED